MTVSQPADPKAQTDLSLQVLDQVISQLEAAHAQDQAVQAGNTSKETAPINTFESIPGAQLEYEDNPEIDPEVKEFVQEVTQRDQLPQEISISGDNIQVSSPQKTAKRAVVVLPITQEIEKQGMKKSPKYSIRWLVEFARKIMKMFVGQVVYKDS